MADYLVDPDTWLLPEGAEADVVWFTEEKLQEMAEELLKGMREKLGRIENAILNQ